MLIKVNSLATVFSHRTCITFWDTLCHKPSDPVLVTGCNMEVQKVCSYIHKLVLVDRSFPSAYCTAYMPKKSRWN